MPLIAIFLPDLRVGGVERMRVNLANQWVEEGFDVEFVLLERAGELIDDLHEDIRVVDLGVRRFRKALQPIKRYLSERMPDSVLAGMWPLTSVTLLAAKLSGYSGPVVVSDHSMLSHSYAHRGPIHRFLLRASLRLTYPLASVRVGVSQAVNRDLSVLSGLPESAFTTIYNPATKGSRGNSPVPLALQDSGIQWVIAVGTFKPVKRFDLLIDAIAQIEEPAVKLCLLGDGPLRNTLAQKIDELGVSDRVIMPGFTADTAAWYANSRVFVLCSEHEGFGNVIVEALEQGVTVVSTRCPGGPVEILADGEFGKLIPVGDVDALAESIKEALDKPLNPEILKARAADFTVPVISGQYLAAMELESQGIAKERGRNAGCA